MQESREKELVERCQAGDLAAFRHIYEQYEASSLRTAMRMLGNRQDAEDAVQTAFIKLFRSIGRFRFDARFSTYLFRILVNVCFDHLHKRKKMRAVEWYEPDTCAHDGSDELRIQLQDAIAGLPKRMRACFILFAIEDLPQKEIAEIMNLSPGGVKATIFQAKARLRTMLSDQLKGEI